MDGALTTVDDSGNEWSQPKKLESATASVEDGRYSSPETDAAKTRQEGFFGRSALCELELWIVSVRFKEECRMGIGVQKHMQRKFVVSRYKQTQLVTNSNDVRA